MDEEKPKLKKKTSKVIRKQRKDMRQSVVRTSKSLTQKSRYAFKILLDLRPNKKMSTTSKKVYKASFAKLKLKKLKAMKQNKL